MRGVLEHQDRRGAGHLQRGAAAGRRAPGGPGGQDRRLREAVRRHRPHPAHHRREIQPRGPGQRPRRGVL